MRNGIRTDAEEVMLAQYLREAAGSRPLSREREAQLAARIKDGDTLARNALAQANLRFVVSVARHYQHRGLSLAELIASGNMGLLKAADRFDGTRGTKFISCAVWWIKQAITKALADQARTVRLPVGQQRVLARLSRASRELGQAIDRKPELGEIADEIGISAEKAGDALQNGRSPIALEELLQETEGGRQSLGELVDNPTPLPDEGVSAGESRLQIDAILQHLNRREYLIIRRYYGTDGEKPQNLGTIGEELNLTRERVRQLKVEALTKLRSPEYRRGSRSGIAGRCSRGPQSCPPAR